jgi:hypothetical protein
LHNASDRHGCFNGEKPRLYLRVLLLRLRRLGIRRITPNQLQTSTKESAANQHPKEKREERMGATK